MTAAELQGIARSLLIYHLPLRQRRLRRLYRQFVGPGELCFDIGAHVGNRVRAFAALGAEVVALEPNPRLAALLRRFYASDRVQILQLGASDALGRAELLVSSRTPTVSTLSRSWIEQVRRDPRFQPVAWDHSVVVDLITLDALIERFGEPVFCKVDVEGHEHEVLAGLSRPLRALSFEYLPACVDRAIACIARLRELGRYRFNWSEGETLRLRLEHWVQEAEVIEMLRGLSPQAASGDIYALHGGGED